MHITFIAYGRCFINLQRNYIYKRRSVKFYKFNQSMLIFFSKLLFLANMSEQSFDLMSNLTEVAGLCYSPVANDALRRVTSQMARRKRERKFRNSLRTSPKQDNEQSIEREHSTSPHLHQLGPTKQKRAAGNPDVCKKLRLKGNARSKIVSSVV